MASFPSPSDASASIQFDVADPTPLAELRSWVRELTGPFLDVELVLTELVTNARDHGGAGPITAEIQRHDKSVTVVVTNLVPLHAAPMPAAAESVDVIGVRGRGLQIAKAVTDQLLIEQIGHTLRISAVVPWP